MKKMRESNEQHFLEKEHWVLTVIDFFRIMMIELIIASAMIYALKQLEPLFTLYK